jgi:hypothetical protein
MKISEILKSRYWKIISIAVIIAVVLIGIGILISPKESEKAPPVVPSKPETPPETPKIEKITLEPPYYLIEGENLVPGFHPEFYNKFKAAGSTGLLGGSPLIEEVEKYYSEIVKTNILFAILPTSSGIKEYQQLEQKHPDIVPLSADKVEEFIREYGVPFLYFVRDSSTNRIRGLIVSNSVDANLADLLLSKGVVTNAPFRYEEGEIKILK